MHELKSLIPSLNALWAFEAAARHLSFTLAAEELAITQPAVSHAVKQLEIQLGAGLFQRQHRSLTLTKEGQRFLHDITIGLSHIQQSAHFIRSTAQTNKSVTISVSTAFATHWLLPRVALFELAHPDIDLRFQTNARDLDLNREGIELGIRQGDGSWRDYHSHEFAKEEVWAVCSPDYAEAHNLPTEPQSLLNERLIHLDEPHRTPMTWKRWFDRLNVQTHNNQPRLKLNDYAIAIQAALDSQGVALGWRHIIQKLLGTRQLVRACSSKVETEQSFYLVMPKNLKMTEQVQVVRDWLLHEAKMSG